jgi:hypothetical protein
MVEVFCSDRKAVLPRFINSRRMRRRTVTLQEG